jgi:hypothetical protein
MIAGTSAWSTFRPTAPRGIAGMRDKNCSTPPPRSPPACPTGSLRRLRLRGRPLTRRTARQPHDGRSEEPTQVPQRIDRRDSPADADPCRNSPQTAQNGPTAPDEIRHAAAEAEPIYAPDLASDPRHARYFDDSEIELVEPLPRDIQIAHAIFDHDGTLWVLRQGWEAVMEPMMCRAVLGDRFDNADAAVYQKVLETVRVFIDKTTGIQTFVQMQGLVRLVREFGFVPESKILDEHGYKAICNDALLELIHTRVRKLKSGELESKDFQIKNA